MAEAFPNLQRWIEALHARPAVEAGRRVGRDLGQRKLTEAEEKARRELLFHQTTESNKKYREIRQAAAQAAS